MKRRSIYRNIAYSFGLIGSLTVPTIALLTSCNEPDPPPEPIVIESIDLVPESHKERISPGEFIQINALINGTDTIINELNWELKQLPFDGPFITTTGLLSVPNEIFVDKEYDITIRASVIDNPDVNKEITFKIVPKPDEFFKGFKDNKILSLAPNYKGELVETPINIVQQGHHYETELPISAFQEQTGPAEWGSIIHFEPIFSDQATSRYMRFSYKNKEASNHGIGFIGYDPSESGPIDHIPDMWCINSKYSIDSLVVTFDCQPEVDFVINFNLYQDLSQSSPVVISYDTQPGDPHEMVSDDQGVYSVNLFCPKFLSRETYSENLSTIYIYRNYYEFTDLKLRLVPGANVPHDIKQAFNFEYEWVKLVRPFDHYVYYKLCVYYSFDLSQIQTNYEIFGYPSYHLVQLDVDDYFGNQATLDFYLSWV